MATITTPAVINGEVIDQSWGNSVRADLLALNAAKAELSGATFTGMVTLPATNPTSANHATRRGYVDTGDLLRALKSGDTFTGNVQVGNGISGPGVRLEAAGVIRSYVGDPSAGSSSLALTRVGSDATDPAQPFIYFIRTASGTLIGSIVINGSATGVNYNATSDRRVKDDLGLLDADDQLGRILALTPRRLRSKATGIEFDGFIADEVQQAIPAAVTGEPDAVFPDDYENEDLAGTPNYQQLAVSEFIVDLVGSVHALHRRVAELEQAVG